MNITETIEKKVSRIEEGTVFTYRDLGIKPTEYVAAAKAIERFIKKGSISRASIGRFYKARKTVFGELKPQEDELLRSYLFKNNKRIAYITGIALYNKLGLTTQIPKAYKVACRDQRITAQVGNIQVKPVKSYVDVTNDNYSLLELLDILKDLKKIPDSDIKMIIRYLLNRIKELSENDLQKLIRACK